MKNIHNMGWSVGYVVFLFLFVLEFSYAQNKNINWCFGDSAGINFSNLNSPTNFKSAVKTRGSCASISDTNGNMLFYYAYTPHKSFTYFYDGEITLHIYFVEVRIESYFKLFGIVIPICIGKYIQ